MEYYGAHRDSIGFELRVTRLGHVVRGGAPGAADRILATRLGAAAVDALAGGQHGVLVGIVRNEVDPHAARRDRRAHAAGRRRAARAGADDGDLGRQQAVCSGLFNPVVQLRCIVHGAARAPVGPSALGG